MRCIEAVEAAVKLPFEQGLALERKFFVELVQSSESKALRHVFFAERAASKIPDVPDETPTRSDRQGGRYRFRHDGRRHRDEFRQRWYSGDRVRKGPGGA